MPVKPPVERAYLRPISLMTGASAAAAISQGTALPISNTGTAFSQCEIIVRDGDRKMVAARDLASSDIPNQEIIKRIRVPRPPMLTGAHTLVFERPLVMGVVNVTPDSFSGDGTGDNVSAAVAQAHRLVQDGADLIDVGGESTRPGAKPVSPDQECARVLPVIAALTKLPVPISIDTRRAQVMDQAVQAGASIINDISALEDDPASLKIAARLGAPVVLGHKLGTPKNMQDAPRYDDVLLDVYDYLAERVETAVAAGIPRDRLIVDPGIGFGKTPEHNLSLLGGLTVFHGLGCPILIGASRKSFIGALAGELSPDARLPGSLATLLAAVQRGATMVRVHDVAETRQALTIWDEISQKS